MKPVIQEEKTGCAIASAAAIAGIDYQTAKTMAYQLGIEARNPALWSDTQAIRRLLHALNITIADESVAFSDWQSLPDCALLAIKWHTINDKAYWHWVVFVRDQPTKQAYVLDSKAALKNHRRTDFGRIKPKWFIEVIQPPIENHANSLATITQ